MATTQKPNETPALDVHRMRSRRVQLELTIDECGAAIRRNSDVWERTETGHGNLIYRQLLISMAAVLECHPNELLTSPVACLEDLPELLKIVDPKLPPKFRTDELPDIMCSFDPKSGLSTGVVFPKLQDQIASRPSLN